MHFIMGSWITMHSIALPDERTLRHLSTSPIEWTCNLHASLLKKVVMPVVIGANVCGKSRYLILLLHIWTLLLLVNDGRSIKVGVTSRATKVENFDTITVNNKSAWWLPWWSLPINFVLSLLLLIKYLILGGYTFQVGSIYHCLFQIPILRISVILMGGRVPSSVCLPLYLSYWS